MVRNIKTSPELIDDGGPASPEVLRPPRRIFTNGGAGKEPDIARDIAARTKADFDRIFSSED